MSTFDPLKLTFNNVGSATLSSHHYNELDVNFDQSIVEHLRGIDVSSYYLVTNVTNGGNEWEFSHLTTSDGAAIINFISGIIKKEGKKIICTAPRRGVSLSRT